MLTFVLLLPIWRRDMRTPHTPMDTISFRLFFSCAILAIAEAHVAITDSSSLPDVIKTERMEMPPPSVTRNRTPGMVEITSRASAVNLCTEGSWMVERFRRHLKMEAVIVSALCVRIKMCKGIGWDHQSMYHTIKDVFALWISI